MIGQALDDSIDDCSWITRSQVLFSDVEPAGELPLTYATEVDPECPPGTHAGTQSHLVDLDAFSQIPRLPDH